MEHKEYIRLAPGSKAAVLFIHGIAGSPNHFDSYVSLLKEDVSVYNMLLDGHGKGVRDFSKTAMKKWEAQVAAAVDMLSESHESICIAAHSMGTLFAIDEAIHNPKIKKLFLLAVPIKLFLKPAMLSNMYKIYSGKAKPDDRIAAALVNCCSITQDKNILRYIGWIPRYIELFSKISKTRKCLKSLSTPTFVYQSARDEMVAKSAAKLLGANPSITVNILEHSRHFYYEPEEQAQLNAAFSRWLEMPLSQKERAYAYLRSIPKGKVVTYKQVAMHLGSAKLAQHVGNLLHQNPDGDFTPCYKVVNSAGKLAEHYAFGGADAQKARLEAEGIEVQNGKVDLTKYQYDTEDRYEESHII